MKIEKLNNMSDDQIRAIGMEALRRELGVVGTIRFLEQFDNGGYGDYTKEKYKEADLGLTKEEFMNKYTKKIMWSDEDDCYIVSVLELPGCMADGKTQEEALANADIIILEWLETAEVEGREIPQPKGFVCE